MDNTGSLKSIMVFFEVAFCAITLWTTEALFEVHSKFWK